MNDAEHATDLPTSSRLARREDGSSAFEEWCDQEQERRRARDVELDEGLFAEARALVQRRLNAKDPSR